MKQYPSGRRRSLSAALCVLLMLAGSVSGPITARAGEDPLARALEEQKALQARITRQQDAVAELEHQGTKLQTELDATTALLESTNADLDALHREIATASTQLAAAEAHHAGLVTRITRLDGTIAFLQGQADELRDDIQARRDVLAVHLVEAYRAGQSTFIEQWLSGDSLLEGMIEQRGYLTLGDRDVELAHAIERDAALLASQRRDASRLRFRTERLRRDVAGRASEIDVARDRLLAARARTARLEAETRRSQEQQAAAFHAVTTSREQARAVLESQLRSDRQLDARIATLVEEQRHAGRLPSEYNGTFRWPVEGTVTQEFGCTGMEWEPPLGACAHFHKGIDVVAGAGEGAPVLAAADGVVLFVGWNPYDVVDPAWIVIIAHSDRLTSWYAHLQARPSSAVQQGMTVTSGQTIGWMGNTGHSTGAHLHWGVQLDSTFRDPRLFL